MRQLNNPFVIRNPKVLTPTSQDFITKYNLKTASSVQTAVKSFILKNYT